VRADALDQRPPLPHPCPDRQGQGGTGAGEEARLNALLGPANRAALLAMLAKIAREF